MPQHALPEHILLVEDDDGLRRTLAEVLKQAGYIVHPFPDYRGVMELLDIGSQADLLLTDLALPDGMPQGVSVAAMARYRRPKLPVVFLTGYPKFADFVRQWDKVLMKPIGYAALLEIVAASLTVADSGE